MGSLGYFISNLDLDEKSILKYVRWQQTQDLDQAKFELFRKSGTGMTVELFLLASYNSESLMASFVVRYLVERRHWYSSYLLLFFLNNYSIKH